MEPSITGGAAQALNSPSLPLPGFKAGNQEGSDITEMLQSTWMPGNQEMGDFSPSPPALLPPPGIPRRDGKPFGAQEQPAHSSSQHWPWADQTCSWPSSELSLTSGRGVESKDMGKQPIIYPQKVTEHLGRGWSWIPRGGQCLLRGEVSQSISFARCGIFITVVRLMQLHKKHLMKSR